MSENDAAVLRPGGRDYLVPFPVAASTLGRSTDTLDAWEAKGLVPAVELEGGRKSTFASWLAAVMRSARPGRAGKLADVTSAWWAAHEAAAAQADREVA
jgi:hypothetical protein